MLVLLDELVPGRLAPSFPESFATRTVQHMGWSGCGNGELLPLAVDHEFDAIVTVDQGFEHQQNVHEPPLPVVIMLAGRTRLKELRPLVAEGIAVLSGDLEF